MIEKLLQLITFLVKPFYIYYKFFTLNRVFSIKAITDKAVYIAGQPKDKDILYVIKLESRNNGFESLKLDEIKRELGHLQDSQLTYYFIKNDNLQAGYAATFSREIAQAISDKLGLKILNVTETVQFLLNIYSVTDYYFDVNSFTIEPTISAKRINNKKIADAMQYNLSTILKEGAFVMDEKYKLYQVAKYTNKQDIVHTKAFRKDFDGILQMSIDLSNKGSDYLISKAIRYARIMDRKILDPFEELANEQKQGRLKATVCNSIILASNDREAYHTASSLGFEIIEKKINKIEILSKSLMITKELDYDSLLPTDYVNRIVGVRSKRTFSKADVYNIAKDKSWVDVKIDFYGRDLYDAPTNFSYRMNENPHSVLIADAGTGKSVAVQKIIKSILRYSITKNKVDRFREVKTRYFEIGGSSAKLLQKIKALHPNDVGIIAGSVDTMRFSVIDIKIQNEEKGATVANTEMPIVQPSSLLMACFLINVILEEGNEAPLTSSEESVFNTVVKNIYKYKKFKFKTLAEIEDLNDTAYKDTLDEAYAKGYHKTTRTNEIDNVHDIGRLQKPTISDVMSEVIKRSKNSDITDIDKKIHESLYIKLKTVKETEVGLFGSLSSITFNDKQFYSFEFNRIKDNPKLLKIIFTFLFTTVYQQDILYAEKMKAEGKTMPQTMYIFEESKNFIHGNASITRMLEKAVLEGRKFQIHALFVAQQIEHLPMTLIEACSSFMFLMPEGNEQRASLANKIRKMYPDEKSVEFLLNNIEFRAIGIISSSGVSSCKLELTQEELEMFAS